MKTTLIMTLLLFPLLVLTTSFAQTYQGPAVGSVTSGGTVSTGTFFKTNDIGTPKERGTRNVVTPYNEPVTIDFGLGVNPIQSTYTEDPNIGTSNLTENSPSILVKSFKGHSMGNSIPPDPHVAVGPTHIISTVNVGFNIFDKEGNLVKSINPDTWFQSLVPSPDCFDPNILYDHFDKRWIMTWDSQDDALQRAHFMVAVSDDSIPLGTWYTWALPANQNGNTVVSNWGDYPQTGFDKNAFYINSRQFGFGGGYQYNKIRIIKKSDLYNNPGGALSWTDIWDITDPQVASTYKPDVIIPAINYGQDNVQYFLHARRDGGNFVSLYKITDPTGTPVLTRTNIFVENYSVAPNANQLGGGSPLISSNESAMKTQPTFRDGFIWGVHSIANPSSTQNSAVRYYKINTVNSSLVETGTLGASNYWYIFPAIAVDKDQNIAITYSRSATTEYCGAYYTTRLKNDPAGLSGSQVLQTGKGNYVVTFGGSRNRWGDYTGIYTDPSDESNLWLHTEFAEQTNRWGTWIGKVRMTAFPGVRLFTATPTIDFGNVEVNFSSSLIRAVIKNHGTQSLVISNIADSSGAFYRISSHTFPINLNSFDSLVIELRFSPKDTGNVNLNFSVSSNDPSFTGFAVSGKGYVIKPAVQNVLYSSSGINNASSFSILNTVTGIGTNVGLLLYSDVKSISVNPLNKVVYGISTGSSSSKLLRVNAEKGDAYALYEYPIGDLAAIAFDTLGTLYAAGKNGNLYLLNLNTGQLDSFARAPIQITSIAINPTDNQLWASIFIAVGAGKDRIYKLNKINGDTTRVGQTGFAVATNGLAFDYNGNLFGVTGSTSIVNNLISINTTDGVGTIIGATGLKHLTGLAYLAVKPTSIESVQLPIPSDFSLKQNYPNPFNPSTSIEFTLPVISNVKIQIYNLLGQTVKVLIDGYKNSGYHKLNWNSDDAGGNLVSSGIYFYEMNAKGIDGREFSQLRKMILIK
jgi:hypothetical protein